MLLATFKNYYNIELIDILLFLCVDTLYFLTDTLK